MTIKFNNINIPNYLKEIINLYILYSDIIPKEENLKNNFSIFLKEITNVYEIGSKTKLNYNFITYPIEKLKYNKDNSIIICFSGGKDSTALAIKMKELNYNVILYYVKGINKAYPEEEKRVIEIAKYLNIKYFIEDRFKFIGKSDFPDNPIKNQLIISMALNYAYENNYNCNIGFGDFNKDDINKCDFLTSWSDTIEMQNAYKNFIINYIPDYNYIAPFESEWDTIKIINEHLDILPLTQSCVSPYRFRNSWKTMNENKYNIELPDNRCGSCYKCAREYIHLCNLNNITINKEYYNHCLNVLKNTLKKQHPEFLIIDDKTAYEYYIKLPYNERKNK